MTGLMVIMLPAGITIEQMQAAFTQTLARVREDVTRDDQGSVYYLPDTELMPTRALSVKTELMILADNLIMKLGSPKNQLDFMSRFFREYYGPQDEINHEVVTAIANLRIDTKEFNYFVRNGLEFLVIQCKSLVR